MIGPTVCKVLPCGNLINLRFKVGHKHFLQFSISPPQSITAQQLHTPCSLVFLVCTSGELYNTIDICVDTREWRECIWSDPADQFRYSLAGASESEEHWQLLGSCIALRLRLLRYWISKGVQSAGQISTFFFTRINLRE